MEWSDRAQRLFRQLQGAAYVQKIKQGLAMNERVKEKNRGPYLAPVASMLSAIGSLACCLSLAFLGAAGAAGAGAVLAAFRPWLLVLSAVLLVVGFVKLYREGKSCRRRKFTSVIIFWVAVTIFLAMLFFPQQVATLLAGH